MSFERFTSRITVRGHIIAETGLHIGGGSFAIDPSATDSPVMRDAAGRPFIPGSSFKGALRSYVESLIRGLNRQTLSACDPLAAPCIPNLSQNDRPGIDDLKATAEKEATTNERLDRIQYNQLLTKKILDQSCIICRLFGSPWIAAHLLIKDLFIIPDWWAGRFERRDGVGIDRDTGTARHGFKYDFEVVPATTHFALEIVAENADDELLGLFAIGMREMEQQRVTLGGKTTRGLGRVKLELTEIEIVGDTTGDNFDGTGTTAVVSYFINGHGKCLKGAALHDYLRSKITTLIAVRINDKE